MNSQGRMMTRAQVILYSKPGCHLCEQMKLEIAKAQCSALFDLKEINIESDSKLMAQYQNDIPVLSINGVEVFKHRLSSEAFRDHLTQLPG
jgi:glutaredoxin